VPKSSVVLIVDDEPSVLELHVDRFVLLGFHAVSTHRPDEAVEMLAFHLLFTDVQIPHMDGCELAEKARAIRPELKIIFTFRTQAAYSPGTVSSRTLREGSPH
jgi:CheY-like chemotaxis protein